MSKIATFQGPDLDLLVLAHYNEPTNWTYGAVEAVSEDRIATPVGHEPPSGQATLTWIPERGWMICIPKLGPTEPVSRVTLLLTAFMIKAAKDQAWGDALIEQHFPTASA
jgi:hypothetical protein